MIARKRLVATRITTQMRTLRPLLLWTYLPAVAALGAAQFVSIRDDVPMGLFTRDPLANFAGASPFVGALSNLGVLVWAAAAAICLFGYTVLRRSESRGEWSGFLLAFGLVTLWLALDDLYLLHERVIPGWTGLSEQLIYLIYAVGIGGLLLRFRGAILESDFLPLLLSLLFFTASVLFDLFHDREGPGHHLMEDGAKFLGAVGWMGYLARIAFSAIRTPARRREEG